jgi:hypothetical protein
MKLSQLSGGFIGTSQSLNDLVANPSGLAIFLCPPFGQPFGVGHFFMPDFPPRRLAFDASSLAAVRAMQCFRCCFKTDARRQFSSSGARDVVRDC